VKVVGRKDENLVFYLAKGEKKVLLDLLNHYPLLPTALSRSKRRPRASESPELLEEALQEQRKANKQALQEFLREKGRFQQTTDGWHLRLTPAQAEWLLQIVNDVRVGSWILLGSPDEKKEVRVLLNPEKLPIFWLMQVCGTFEIALLEALERP
jgi:hypothetical protein